MKLDKVLTYQKGKSPEKNFVSNKQVLYLTPEYLRGKSAPNFISDFPSKVEVEDGDLLLLWDGSNAGEFFIGKSGALSSTMVKFHFDEEEHNREFLYYQLKAFEGYLKSQTNGSGIPHVDRELLLGLEIRHFNKLEQTQIATILKTADESVSQTEKLIAKYQRIKTGLLQDLLTKGIDAQGSIRNKITHKFVVKKDIEVPEDWEVVTVHDVLNDIEQGWSPDCEGDEAPTNEWGVLKTTSVTWEGFNGKENKKLPEKLIPKGQYEIKDNDVLITRAGPNSRVGVVAYVKTTRRKLILSDKLYRLISNSKIIPEFLALTLANPNTQRHLSNLKTGMAESQTNISQAIIKALVVSLPDVTEQKMIIEYLNVIETVLSDYKFHRTKLHSIRTGLMQDLLSAKVGVGVKIL